MGRNGAARAVGGGTVAALTLPGRRGGSHPSQRLPPARIPEQPSDAIDAAANDLVANELPESLVDFARNSGALPKEPARKRQKTGEHSRNDRTVTDLTGKSVQGPDFVTLCKASWEVRCIGCKLSNLQTPLKREDIKAYIRLLPGERQSYVEIVDDDQRTVYWTTFPAEDELPEEIKIAVEIQNLSSKEWARVEGKIWTILDVVLFHKEDSDHLRLDFTIRWNVTTSPYNLHQATKKPAAISRLLNHYFPDDQIAYVNKWSPQDFYNSVHVPPKEDAQAASIQVDLLETELYPFQKRSLQWLLRREGVEWGSERVQKMKSPAPERLPHSFVQCKDVNGRIYYASNLYGVVTYDVTPFLSVEQNSTGGILSEEMGLGKSVEVLSLITLHRRDLHAMDKSSKVFDPYTEEEVTPTNTTLIITPPAILGQWLSEIKRYAPSLKVMHYQGLKLHKETPTMLLANLADCDIVLTTYGVLSAELNFTKLNPEKVLRGKKKYERPKSPLLELQFFRVAIDEAQMIESGVSAAAIVARTIPRVHAWCITGTPVRNEVGDLQGLLIFLRKEPYASNKHVWSSLVSSHKHNFQTLFGSLALRHSKQAVRDELRLPAQRRYVITMPFTPIEEQHYQELFLQMCEEIGLDSEGTPTSDNWDPKRNSTTEAMRTWLLRLRQTALHPEVGGRNRRALGNGDSPLRTVDQVLDAMMDQTDSTVRADQRSLLMLKLKRGQLFENSPRVKEALAIWTEAHQQAASIVAECREQLRLEHENVKASSGSSRSTESAKLSDVDSDEADEQEEVDATSRLGVFRNRLRAALEIEHMAVFFLANAHFQIKSNEGLTQPESPEFEALDKLETEGYEKAKKIRQEILLEIFRKANKLMRTITKRAANQSFSEIPDFPTAPPKGGIESRRIMERLDELGEALDAQANQLDEWRESTIQFLLRPLVDEDDGVEITGDEYDSSTKTQDEVLVYIMVLKAVITDRHEALTGQENKLTEFDVKVALRLAKEGEGAFPQKTIELLAVRQQIKPPKEMGSVRGVVADLRALTTSLRLDADNGSGRAQNELSIVNSQLKLVQKHLSDQVKASSALEKEIELFNTVSNARIEYYRQLQEVSDMVAPYEGVNNERVLEAILEEEAKLERKIATAKAKRRYLLHLREEAINPTEQRICIICRESFEMGALTVCGHQYCKECIKLWWSTHHNCPVCKKKLTQADLHDITYKPQELSIQAEEVATVHQQRSPSDAKPRKSAIYSEISKAKLAEIKNVELDGPSFTTKVDTLARHLIWLRESDPGAKSIIFSQFRDFLDVLARAFTRFRIGYASIDKPDGITRFKEDPGTECFLLHARAHSSGLNLVNASHVFLCEPLLNTAIELQAIARVDRIGQHQETSVWLYLVQDTVEESIHQLSVRRRMEHMGQSLFKKKGKSKSTTPEEILDSNLEEANSMELQQAALTKLLMKGGKGGEMVENEDLWDCLFGGVEQRKQMRNSDLRHNTEARRHLVAEAAEHRWEQ
ncbi:hypothetical protein BP5796_09119 [Coleophoma crateriformis]|uniref:Uncharacterized protein n=1 Tax=Coleophoma crateriformis TaxID=565419 RepID=A0A3D8R336_9HELO|nr:hypothetical protein BP5796_09119 [Coleophoma crateriformis]